MSRLLHHLGRLATKVEGNEVCSTLFGRDYTDDSLGNTEECIH